MSNSVSLTDSQKEAIEESKRHLQIIACAGSGKTEVITRRIAGILKDRPDILPENIVAFTFTEKAAASMKVRIKKPWMAVTARILGTCTSAPSMPTAIPF